MNDRDLVRRMLRGDEGAFTEFFDAYAQRLFRFAMRRLDDAAAAEDIVQNTLVTAMRKLSTWRGEAALFTWLCTLCRHEIAAHWRRAAHRPQMAALDDDPDVRATVEALAADIDLPDRALERRELSRLVQLTLDYLPGRYGDVLEWKYAHGLSVAEIAERLGSTPKAAESTLTRARHAFREGFATLAHPSGGLEP
jgi:RNA polymerase sigma-70 factor (ECF subfamily)